MKTNQAGIAIIKHYESWSATPYLDPIGIPTIGWGTTEGITMQSPEIDMAEGERMLANGLQWAENAVSRYITVPLSSNQFSALVSLVYNIGSGHFYASTLRRKLNREDYDGAANEFWKWRRSGGIIMGGLVARRASERALFLSE